MREILFKAKRKDNGEWVEGCLITDELSNAAFIGYAFGTNNGILHDTDLVEVDPETVCQYTGFTGKNGKMIFESDIVVAYNEDGTKSKWVVSFQSGCWIVETEKSWDFLAINARDIEVVGNIHDEED